MISLRIIPKIIFQPRAAFEELKGNVTGEDGVIMLFLSSLVALLLYGFAAKLTGANFITFSFGIGPSLTLANAFLYFGIQFFTLIIVAFLSNYIALKFNGTGTFSGTFTFLCYSRVFNIVPAVASAIALLWLNMQVNAAVAALNAGTVGSANYIAQLASASIYGNLIMWLWLLYIMVKAVSVEHSISWLKSFASVVAGYVILYVPVILILQYIHLQNIVPV